MAHEHLDDVKAYLLDLQERLCEGLAAADGRAAFKEDSWQREEGGGGRSRVMESGAIFENRRRQLFPCPRCAAAAVCDCCPARASRAQLPRGGSLLGDAS